MRRAAPAGCCPCGLSLTVPVGSILHRPHCIRSSWEAVDRAVLAAAVPSLRAPIFHTVDRVVQGQLGGFGGPFKGGEIHDRIRQLVKAGTLVYSTGDRLERLRPTPPEHAACRGRTDEERMAVVRSEYRRVRDDQVPVEPVDAETTGVEHG